MPRAHTVFAGPILAPVPPLAVDDPDAACAELARFLAAGRTVHVNLGTLFEYMDADVRALARALVTVRRRLRDMGREPVQVLWKLPHKDRFRALLDEELGPEREGVRIEEWISPPALAVLMHDNVTVSVHHGGAS
jgi:hypothetical protein